jgi:hypothetical protein
VPTALLPEVRESEASPEIQAIYDDIRDVMRVPFVNLIHRYLATIPGALEYAWSLGREACIDGRLDGWVATMIAGAKLGDITVYAAPRLPEGTRETAQRIVEIYNRQNPRNIIIFSAFLTILRDAGAHASDVAPPRLPARKRSMRADTIPELPKFGDLDEQTRALLSELAALQRLEGTGLVPSLYLHLATAPGAVAVAYEAIAKSLRDGVIFDRVESVRASADAAACQLIPAVRALPSATYDRRAEIAQVVASFAERAIPSMVVIGHVLARQFGE